MAVRIFWLTVLTSDAVASYLQADELKLYRLIWERFISCQMTEAVYDATTVTIDAQGPTTPYVLRASG